MGLFDKLKSILTPQEQEKKAGTYVKESAPKKVKVLKKYETTLNGVSASGRQELLGNMGTDETMKVNMIVTGGTLGLSVINPKHKVLGTIPSKIVREFESKYYPHCDAVITSYKIYKNKEGKYECSVNLQLNKES